MSQKSKEDVRTLWVDFIYSSTISIFSIEGNLDVAILDVGPSSDWGVMIPRGKELPHYVEVLDAPFELT